MKFVTPPSGEIVDVVMLVNTADIETFLMTQEAIDSLRKSETSNFFRVILVESNQSPDPNLRYNADVILNYLGDFNYNKALNIAFKNLQSDWVCVSNNDVYFHENWWSNLRYYMDLFDLDSASPRCPVPQFGPSEPAQKLLLSYPSHSVVIGYEAVIQFAGWCWAMKRDLLNTLDFPEELSFWFQDNFLGSQLKTHGYKHGTVTSSWATHYGQKSYKHIPNDKIHSMTMGLQGTYLEELKKLQGGS